MDQVKIGKFLMYLRREKKLTQAQLAEELNVSDKTISKWERGICLPEMNKIDNIIKFFDISLMEFYAGEKNKILNNELVNETTKNVVELSNKSQKRKFRKILLTIFTLFLIIILITSTIFMINTYGKYSEYRIISNSKDYSAEGSIMIAKEKSYITLLNININDEELQNIKAHSYEYELSLDNVLIERNGDIYSDTTNDVISLSDYLRSVSIYVNYDLSNIIYIKEIENQILLLRIKYLDENNVDKTLDLKFVFKKDFSNDNLIINKNNY